MDRARFLEPEPAVKKVIPEWGDVYIRILTGLQWDKIKDAVMGDSTGECANLVKLVQETVCDENGERMFVDDDYEALMKLPLQRLAAIAAVCNEANGFLTDVEETAGKSATT